MSQPFILGGSIRFACVVALLVGNRAIAEKLSNELVSEIRNGHKMNFPGNGRRLEFVFWNQHGASSECDLWLSVRQNGDELC